MARPLNKKLDEGGFYTRRPEIETCIDEADAECRDGASARGNPERP